MTKRLKAILLLLLVAMGLAAQNPLATAGVSRELALHRRATLADVRYDLAFDIPDSPEQPIIATERLTFILNELDDVVLDFREQPEKIHSVMLNKKKFSPEILYEHITIPRRLLRKGENQLVIEFTAGDQSLNRNADYMYTLFVPDRARTAFPCFDQPDIKARFTLALHTPANWKAVANGQLKKRSKKGRRLLYEFRETEPLPTYLFAFAAGVFEERPFTDGSRTITAYYRETDPRRVEQLSEIARQVFYSLRWQEEFTGCPYPFRKYDFVVLPGFQFGGMEHTGCTFYNDNTLFLPTNPTADEQLAQAQLIAHETSHMWFGDYVTMRWFDDVWTKEVFANYFAYAIVRDQFPEANHDLAWLKNYMGAALSEDRTAGGTSIRQQLDNLQDAGLVYNNIIYNKSPIMLRKLVELIGEKAFRFGIQRYIRDFAYGNASWDDLVEILDAETTADVKAFTDVWVNEKGMPTITLRLNEDAALADDQIVVEETDPLGRGLHWPQEFKNETFKYQILPNTDGRGYGFFTLPDDQLQGLMQRWRHVDDPIAKQSLLITLNENYLAGRITDERWTAFIIDALADDHDKFTVSTLISFLSTPLWRLAPEEKAEAEEQLLFLAETHRERSGRIQLLRLLAATATSPSVVATLYDFWAHRGSDLLSVNDYMTFAFELAIRYPDRAYEIIREQSARLSNPDRRRQFDYIARAVVPEQEARDSLFNWLLIPENRRIEPWAGQALYYLNHPLRDEESTKYILPALQNLREVQRTGDIFFPSRWCRSLLQGHQSIDAYIDLLAFLEYYQDYPRLLRNKIEVAADHLYRLYGKPE